MVHLPVPPTRLTTRPLRFPTRFPRNWSIPRETKLGIVYDFLFLTQKHLTRFLNTKHRNENEQRKYINCLAIRWTRSKAMAAPTQNPDTQSRCLSRGDSAGSLKVSSWAATIAVPVHPSRAPGHRAHPSAHRRVSVLLSLCASMWLLNSPEQCSLGSKYYRQFTQDITCHSQVGCRTAKWQKGFICLPSG